MDSSMGKLKNRIYSDYFMHARFAEYESILESAYQKGYKIMSLAGYVDEVLSGNQHHEKVLVCRHDIDTDCEAANIFFDYEQKFGGTATYLFRLSTAKSSVMKKLAEHGADVGYHYEEIASFVKSSCIQNTDNIESYYPLLLKQFETNLELMEKTIGRNIRTVGSHGDFINRKLKIPNHKLLYDKLNNPIFPELIMAYDKRILDSFDVYITDRPYPEYFRPCSPERMLSESRRILFLTHPNQWRVNVRATTKENFKRIVSGVRFKICSLRKK